MQQPDNQPKFLTDLDTEIISVQVPENDGYVRIYTADGDTLLAPEEMDVLINLMTTAKRVAAARYKAAQEDEDNDVYRLWFGH